MRIACVVGPDYEDSELRVPLEAFRRAGHEVVMIGERRGETLHGKRRKDSVTTDASIAEVRPDEFGALFIPGGHSPDVLRADERMVRFVQGFRDRPIVAICHGPQLLMSAGMVRGRRLTAWKTIQSDLRYTQADVVDEEVVRDENLVTSRQPQDLQAFVRESLALFRDAEAQAGAGAGASAEPSPPT
jgi:protease I